MSGVNSITYLVSIDAIDTGSVVQFDYFRLLDNLAVEWFVWFDPSGGLSVSATIPPITGATPVDMTPVGPTPTHLILDNAGTPHYIFPDPISVVLLGDTVQPAGTSWDVGASLSMRAELLLGSTDPQETYLLGPPGTPGDPWTVTQGVTIPIPTVEPEFFFSAGARAPVYDGGLWTSRLRTILNTTEGFQPRNGILGGQSSTRLGAMTVDISDESLDNISSEVFPGRTLKVYRGRADAAFAQFEQVLEADISGVQWDPDEFQINFVDPGEKLRQPIQERIYAGTGGLQGGPDLKGRVIPICYGICFNIRPLLVDSALLIFQFNDGPGVVSGVLDRAVPLTSAGTVVSLGLSDITAWVPVPGQFIVDEALSLIRLGAVPVGQVTADVVGGGLSRPAEIILDILQNRLTSTVKIDLTSVGIYATDLNTPVGIFVENSRSIESVITDLAVGAVWGFNALGFFVIRQVKFRPPVVVISELNLLADNSYRRRPDSPVPPWRLKLGYARSWLKQNTEDVAAGATDARKSFVSVDERFEQSESATVRLQNPASIEVTRSTLLTQELDTQFEAGRQQGVLAQAKDFYEVDLRRTLPPVELVDTATLELKRFGLNSGRDFIVVQRTDEASTSGERVRESVSFLLWG